MGGRRGRCPELRDASIRDASVREVDAALSCEREGFSRTDYATHEGHIGELLGTERHGVWFPTNRPARLLWVERGSGVEVSSPLDDHYSQRASLVRVDDHLIVAWEHTGPRGSPGGVAVATLGLVPGPSTTPYMVTRTGGHPSLALSRDGTRMLLGYLEDGAVVVELDATSGAPLETHRLDESTRRQLHVASAGDGFVVAHERTLYAVPFDLRSADVLTTSTSAIEGLSGGEDVIVTSHADHRVRAWHLDGSMRAERAPLSEPPHEYDDTRVVVSRGLVLAISRRSGIGLVLDADLEEVWKPGPFTRDLASVAASPYGFVALSAPLPVGIVPTVSFIDYCAPPEP